ncbi:MAG: hypothetical protein U0797_09450 [Gemmataceae bacterium]
MPVSDGTWPYWISPDRLLLARKLILGGLRSGARRSAGRRRNFDGAREEKDSMKKFSDDGLSFSYPDDWRRLRGDRNGWTVTAQSLRAAFATISLDRDLPDPRQMVQERCRR